MRAVRALKLTAIFLIGQYFFAASVLYWITARQSLAVASAAAACVFGFLFFYAVESE